MDKPDIDRTLTDEILKIGRSYGSLVGFYSNLMIGKLAAKITGDAVVSKGSRFIVNLLKTSKKKATYTTDIASDALTNQLKKYFSKKGKVLKAKDSNSIIGLVYSGTADMNPCVLEISFKENSSKGIELSVVAHAKEGLIKQKTCK